MSKPGGTSLVAGIDEAGLGPLLGPLVIGYAVLRQPELDTNPWRELSRFVSRKPASDKNRLIVADSKVVFSRNPRGRSRLERTALTFQSLTRPGRRPADKALDFLMGPFAPDPAALGGVPWYRALGDTELPLYNEAGSIELRAERLHRAMNNAGLELVSCGVRFVPAGELNASYDKTHSKGRTLWDMTAPLLQHFWSEFGNEDLFVAVDRHGGRAHYESLLASAIPDAVTDPIRESEGVSEYSLGARSVPGSGHRQRGMRIVFAEKAEDQWFPVALASCFAKYARELVMGAFNEFFSELQPGLKPTAGYTTDGRRWLEDARSAVARARIPERVLVRQR